MEQESSSAAKPESLQIFNPDMFNILGSTAPGFPNPKSSIDFNDMMEAIDQLVTLEMTGKTHIQDCHIDLIQEELLNGTLDLHSENLIIFESKEDGSTTPVLDANGEQLVLNRALAHLFYSEDGNCSPQFEPELGGKQILHGVTAAAIKTPAGDFVTIEWAHPDPEKRNLGLVSGHVKEGSSFQDTMLDEVPEELGLLSFLPPSYRLRGNFRVIGTPGQFKESEPGLLEAKTVFEYTLTPYEFSLVIKEKQNLALLRDILGDKEFNQNREAFKEDHPGQGEIWAIHIISPDSFNDAELMGKMNIGPDLKAFLKEEVFKRELLG